MPLAGGTAAVPGTTAPVWTVSVAPGGNGGYPETTPDGNVMAHSEVAPGSGGTTSALQKLTPSGSAVWQLPPAAPLQPIVGFPSVTDAQSNTYVGVRDSNANPYLESISSSGTVRWITPQLPFPGCCGSIALGWNGDVYTSSRGTSGASHVLGFDESTGTQMLDLGFGDVTSLFAYSGGLIVIDSSFSVYFYSYSGTLLSHVDGGSAVNGFIAYSAASGGDGKVFLAGYSSSNYCATPSVEEITPAGIQWTWTNPLTTSCEQTYLAATPDGGVILHDAEGYVSISSTGAARWTYSPTPPTGSQMVAGFAPVVDVAGHVLIPFNYQYTTPQPIQRGIGVDVLSESSASMALPSVDVEETQCASAFGDELLASAGTDVGPNQVYLGVMPLGCDPAVGTIQAFSEPGLGANYRLNLVTPRGVTPTQLLLTANPTNAPVGDQSVLSAMVQAASGQPVSGASVRFQVTSGPDKGVSAVMQTDGNGIATTSLSDTTLAGTDQVQAFLDSNGNGLLDPGELVTTATVSWTSPCAGDDAVLLGARGSGDNSNGVDYPGHIAIDDAQLLQARFGLRLYDDDSTPNDGVVGVTYPAVSVLNSDAIAYSASVQYGVKNVIFEMNRLRQLCGSAFPILLVGYSQGAHVMQTTLERLDDAATTGGSTWQTIRGVALFASPRFAHDDPSARGTYVGDWPAEGIAGPAQIRSLFRSITRSYCVTADPVCVYTLPNLFTAKTHKVAYDGTDITQDAAGLLAWDTVANAPANPSGSLSVYRQNLANTVRVSAAGIYTRGAPTVQFKWDFESDGTVDLTTSLPWVAHNYGIAFFGKKTLTTTVYMVLADQTSIVRSICIRQVAIGNVTC